MADRINTTRLVVAGFIGLAVAQGIGRFAFTPLLPMMINENFLTVTQGGQLASINFLGYLIGSYLAVKSNTKNMMLWSLMLVAIATISMGLTNNITVWMLSRLLAGIASAFTMVVVSGQIISMLPSKRSHAWIFCGVGVSIIISGGVTILLMLATQKNYVGWLAFGIVAVVGAVIAHKLTGTEANKKNQDVADERDTQDGRKPIWSIVIPYGLVGAAYVIPATYLPIMAKQTIDSPILFGLSWPIFGTAALVSVIAIVRLSEYATDKKIWIVSQTIMCIGLILPVIYSSLLSVTLAGLLVGATFVVITLVGLRESHRAANHKHIQYHVAIMTTSFAFGQMVSPFLAGWVFDQTGTFSAPLILASALLAASLPMLRQKK